MEKLGLEIGNLADQKLQTSFEKELKKVIEDILDTDKDPCAKRTIELKIEIEATEERDAFVISASAKSKLAKRLAGSSFVKITRDQDTGQLKLFEINDNNKLT